MKLQVTDLDLAVRMGSELAMFRRPVEIFDISSGEAFANARDANVACLRWIWAKWLSGSRSEEIRPNVSLLISRALELMQTCSSEFQRGLHDLFLLHCAILGSSMSEMKQVAEAVTFCTGSVDEADDGERYARAWAGMLKFWILSDWDKVQDQASRMRSSVKPLNCRLPAMALVDAWLASDWKKLHKEQIKAFEKLWLRMKRDGAVTDEGGAFVSVKITGHPIRSGWCWADNAFSRLAHKAGACVATDLLWLPECALV
jgi:hypothetical protein